MPQLTDEANGVPQTRKAVATRRHERPWPRNQMAPGHGLTHEASDVVGHRDGRVIREALRILVGAANLEGTRTLTQGGRRVLIVDAPARVIDEA